MKKTISLIHGWIHGSTCSRKQQMHNIWIFTAVFSNMTNHSFNFFVSFSINDWKNKRWKFKYLPFLRRNTELYLLLSTHREWDSFFVASCKCCQQRLRSRWALFICSAVFDYVKWKPPLNKACTTWVAYCKQEIMGWLHSRSYAGLERGPMTKSRGLITFKNSPWPFVKILWNPKSTQGCKTLF